MTVSLTGHRVAHVTAPGDVGHATLYGTCVLLIIAVVPMVRM
jgi:hypothetical protein